MTHFVFIALPLKGSNSLGHEKRQAAGVQNYKLQETSELEVATSSKLSLFVFCAYYFLKKFCSQTLRGNNFKSLGFC